ncbi:MAG: MFS transporter [Chloroflexi bacterium]|nr:MFS transporter [Chloroflexota bacterium]
MSTQVTARPLGELLNQRQKMVLLVSLMLTMFIGALDQTIVATATPKIVADLGGFNLLSWVFTSYMLASTVSIPLVGKLSDMFGRKLFLIAGIILFTIASALVGAAPSLPALIAFRAVQGIGGGVIFATVFSTVGDLFPPAERGKYMGFFTGTFSLASILGPTVGGLLTDTVGWRWVFYINVPFAFVAIPAILRNLPSAPRVTGRRIDYVGAFCLSVATVALLLALVWGQADFGWSSPQTLGLLAGTVVFLAAFILQEKRHPEPIIPLGLFRNRTFVIANLLVFALGGGMFGAITYLPTFVQTSLDGSATASGLITTPQSAGLLLTSIIGGQLISRTGRYLVQTILGAILALAGTLSLTTIGVGTPEWHVSAFMVVLGLGFGLVIPTMSVVIQNAVSHQFLGVATSARQFFMQIGQVLGIAVFGVVLATTYRSAFQAGLTPEVRAGVPAATIEKFDDPTLALNKPAYAVVSNDVRSLDGGDQLLASTLNAQRHAVATAVRRIFILSALVGAFALLMACLLREVPLRRSFGVTPEPARPGLPESPAGGALPETLLASRK